MVTEFRWVPPPYTYVERPVRALGYGLAPGDAFLRRVVAQREAEQAAVISNSPAGAMVPFCKLCGRRTAAADGICIKHAGVKARAKRAKKRGLTR